MRNRLLAAVLSVGLLCGSAGTGFAATYSQQRTRRQYARQRYIRHKRRVNTAKRVGIGAAGGAAIGALAAGGKGAALGGIAGAGAGALYDGHQKNHGHN
jgi:outer membrane lipoprotein SlyB